MSAATQFYVSGPAFVWLGIGESNAWEFFGFTESGLTVRITGHFEDIPVDFAGMMPGDVSMLGQDWYCTGVFKKYYEPVGQQAVAFLNNATDGAAYTNTPGFGQNNTVGSLMNSEGHAYPLLVYSPYSFKPEFSGSMVPGFTVGSAYLVDPYEVGLNVRAKGPTFAWRAIPVFGTGSSVSDFTAGAPYNSYQLYSPTVPGTLPATY
jgi:hypothetical protein